MSIDLYNNEVFLYTRILDETPINKNVHSQTVNMDDAHHASMSHLAVTLEFTMMDVDIADRLVNCQ